MGKLDINVGKLKKNAFRYSKVRGETASRIRIPGGVIDADSLAKVVEIAEKYGQGVIDLTNRQGIEIPGIKMEDMEHFYAQPKIPGGAKYASCDIAFEGGDSLVMWLWEGMHIKDIYVCRNNAKTTINNVKVKLGEWGVLEENFVYDLNGLGQTFRGFFPRAKPFNNMEGVDPKYKGMYHDLKSQCAYIFAHKLMDGEMSIEPRLLSLRFSGRAFDKAELRQILMRERKAIRPSDDSSDKGFTLIRKAQMKAIVGHSPDYIEALLMRMVFEIGKGVHRKPRGLPVYLGNRSIISKI